MFGVGERMITARSEPVFGGVYKLAAVEDGDGKIIPKIKVSENLDKITIPHFKKTYRIFDNASGKAEADYITVWDETVDRKAPHRALRSQGYLEAQDLYELYRKAPSGPGLSGRRAGLSAAPPCRDQAYCRARWMPCSGHGEAFRTSAPAMWI